MTDTRKAAMLDPRELLEMNLAQVAANFDNPSANMDRPLGMDWQGRIVTERSFRQNVMAEIVHAHVMRQLFPTHPAGLDRLVNAKGL